MPRSDDTSPKPLQNNLSSEKTGMPLRFLDVAVRQMDICYNTPARTDPQRVMRGFDPLPYYVSSLGASRGC